MTRQDLRKEGIDIIIHPMLIGLEAGQKKAYSFSIFVNEEELGSMEENPDFETYEEAEAVAVERATIWVQAHLN